MFARRGRSCKFRLIGAAVQPHIAEMKRKRRQQDTPKVEPQRPSAQAAEVRRLLADLGRTIMQKMFRMEGVEFSEQPLEPVLEWLNCDSVEDLYVALGQGHFVARTVFDAAFQKISKANIVFLSRARALVDESNTDVDLGFSERDTLNIMDNAADIAALQDHDLKKLFRAVAAEVKKRGLEDDANEPPRLDDAATVRALAGLEHLQKQFAAASELPEAERVRLARQFVRAFERLQDRGVEVDAGAVRAARQFLTAYNRRQKAAKIAALS